MRMITGALLILSAEQAFSHAHLVEFPHQVYVRDILLPSSLVMALLGIGFLFWGTLTERK